MLFSKSGTWTEPIQLFDLNVCIDELIKNESNSEPALCPDEIYETEKKISAHSVRRKH